MRSAISLLISPSGWESVNDKKFKSPPDILWWGGVDNWVQEWDYHMLLRVRILVPRPSPPQSFPVCNTKTKGLVDLVMCSDIMYCRADSRQTYGDDSAWLLQFVHSSFTRVLYNKLYWHCCVIALQEWTTQCTPICVSVCLMSLPDPT